MQKLLKFGGIILYPAFLCLSSGVGYGTTITFTTGGVQCGQAGVCTAKTDASTIDFDNANSNPYTVGIATFSFSVGALSPFVSGTQANYYVRPIGDSTGYLAVGYPGGPGKVAINFASPIDYYGLYLGSPDPYNVFEFYERADDTTPVATYTGSQLIPPALGIPTGSEYLNFMISGGSVSKIVLTSDTGALESDNHAYTAILTANSVPEPSTFGVAGGALAFLGFAARRRRS